MTGQNKWGIVYEYNKETWNKIYAVPFRVTNNTKLQWFQFRVNHCILTTNSYLCKIGLTNNPLCVLCFLERETIIHILWECKEVQNFLSIFDNLVNALAIPFSINKETIKHWLSCF